MWVIIFTLQKSTALVKFIMKIIMLFLFLLFFMSMGYGQNNYSKQIIGSWDLIDTTHNHMNFRFMDSAHIISTFYYPEFHTTVKGIGHYFLHMEGNLTSLTMVNDTVWMNKKMTGDVNLPIKFLIKFPDSKTFKLQLYRPDQIKWVNDDHYNSGIFTKKVN